jgi:hypothetical protein
MVETGVKCARLFCASALPAGANQPLQRTATNHVGSRA